MKLIGLMIVMFDPKIKSVITNSYRTDSSGELINGFPGVFLNYRNHQEGFSRKICQMRWCFEDGHFSLRNFDGVVPVIFLKTSLKAERELKPESYAIEAIL